ncbi:Stk1 family PASTA domain-containing Ser/Thr kinase [Ilumatobacter sp.]|uniref:Stk1 family PASTA domain-containing Ser/Thr kinase n=1 Tax=Ilumatobacter sp. TaxID=1967498 RepID=UPI003B52C027
MTNHTDATVINDRYEVHKRIGRGGMADVFSARDLLLDRQVAIKVLFPEFATDDNFVERFRREAQSAANLSHPNIVNVYDWGKYEGTYFIAMEEVQGRTLADILSTNGPLTSKQATEIASEVAGALGFAHEKGTAHRDIKPANILIGTNGQVKVADFGIARAMNAPTEANLTQVGSVMGTATYFSPEQAQGAQPDPRSDLYSLGIVMYEMVAGRAPFTGDNPVSIAYKQVHDAPRPLVQIVADVPKGYEAMVAKLLAKDPKVRYPSATALRDDLRRFKNGEPVQALVAAANQRNGADGAPATTAMAAATAATAPPRRAQSSGVPSSGMYEAGYPTGASAEAAYYDTSGSRTGWYALVAFIALVGLVVGGVLLYQSLAGEEASAEPTTFVLDDYSGTELSVVSAELLERGLDYVPVAEPNASVPPGFVHRTDPIAGAVVLENQTIQVFYNPDEQLRNVPQVIGLQVDAARDLLTSLGFRVGAEIPDDTSDRPEGQVLASEPEAGTAVPQDTVVSLTIAAPSTAIAVPGVVSFTEDQAIELLSGPPYEFSVSVERATNETVPEGQVVSVDPARGDLVERGGPVTITVSSGPAPVTMPVVEGDTQGNATNKLRGLGLVVEVEFSEVDPGSRDDGRVRTQDPGAGTQVERGATVTIVVGRATTTVPPPPPPPPPPPSTAAPTTAAPTTAAPTTARPTTVAPSTAPPTTAPPTTAAP